MADTEKFPADDKGRLINPEVVSKEGERLLQALRDTKPSFLSDGHGVRGPQPPPRSDPANLSRNDFPRGQVTREPKQPFFPEKQSAAASIAGTANQITPFFVTPVKKNGITSLKVYPGRIAGIVPTINGVKLDNKPTPSLGIVGVTEPFTMFLRSNITVDPDNLFRESITAVKVCTDNDSDVTPDIDGGTGEVPELKAFWENDPTNTIGHFYIRIADIDVNADGQLVGLPRQWLFQSYSSFAATAQEIVITP